ncbi:MAG: site-2 protease family protein [candidate division Zixibacteria bacterium]|nr:site-2 protease family protein [candidate division Zixibacteria bacterium]
MNQKETDANTIISLVQDLFEISAVYRHGTELVISLSHRFDPRSKALKITGERLKMAGYRFRIEQIENGAMLYIDPRRQLRIPPLNIILFLATIFSVYVVPVFLKNLGVAPSFHQAFNGTIVDLKNGVGIEFTLALMSILLVHEMGHFVASRRRNIITSWPYFIPAPNIIGTFGAIIKSRSPFFNRRNLIEVGAAGPLAGWVIALFWLIYGLSQSTFLPPAGFEIKDFSFALEGESILMRAATQAIVGVAPDGYYYRLTEAAFAGWVGMLVTAINLLPIGQLDGGHILYGLVRKHQYWLGMIAMGALFVLGFQSPMWWVFAIFGIIFRVKHPPTINDNVALPQTAMLMGLASIVILILSFTPIPFR